MLHLRRWSLLLVDPNTRPGFSKLLDRIEGNGVRVGLIEDATRFASRKSLASCF